jgi:hypothetical protein
MTDLQDVAIEDIYELIEAIDGGNVTDQHPSGSCTPFAQVVDPSRFADRLHYRHHHSHGEATDCLLYLNEPMSIVAPSRHVDKMYQHWHSHAYLVGIADLHDDTSRLLADRLFRYHHSHRETKAQPLYPNEPMPALDPSRFADRQYRHHHSHGEITTRSLIPSDHMKYVWKLIEWENGEATTNSLSTHAANDLAAINEVIAKDLAIDGIIPRLYIEKKTQHILRPLLSIKNNWLSSMSASLL